jgi:hypothetical protein
MDSRITTLLLSTFATFLYSAAYAQQLAPNTLTTAGVTENLLPTVAGTVLDEFPFDGFPNDFDREFTVVNLTSFEPLTEALSDRRAVVEFDLSSIAGRSVRRAILKLRPSVISVPDGAFVIPIEVRRYQGNGVLNLADFHRGTFVTAFDMRSIRIDSPTTIDLTQSVRRALSLQWTYLGFTLRTNVQSGVSFGVLGSFNPPTLVITFN